MATSILYELRYPTKWYFKLLTVVLALVFFTRAGHRGDFRHFDLLDYQAAAHQF